MQIILNLGVVAFLVGMTFFWGIQGALSALLHLVAVVVALAITFALWEPLSLRLVETGALLALNAWGVSLLATFALTMGLLRFASNKAVQKNIHFSQAVNQVVGGVFGLAAGILTAGFIFIAVSFLPIAGDIGGYDPLKVELDGRIAENPEGGLWIPVDRWAGNFIAMMSNGAMRGGRPMADAIGPDLLHEAAVFRLATAYDPNLSLVAGRNAVSLAEAQMYTNVREEHLPGAAARNIRGRFNVEGARLLFLSLNWVNHVATLDNRGNLRLPPTQVRLLVTNPQTRARRVLEPVGGVRRDPGGTDHRFFANNISSHYLFSSVPEGLTLRTDWVFSVPEGFEPRFVRVRNLRIPIRTYQTIDVGQIAGQITQPELAISGLANVAMDTTGAVADIRFEQTDRLPVALSSNWGFMTGISVESQAIRSGSSSGTPPGGTSDPGRGPQRIERVNLPAGNIMIRAELTYEDLRAVLEAVRQSADDDRGFWLDYQLRGDSLRVAPIGYFRIEQGNRYRFSFAASIQDALGQRGDIETRLTDREDNPRVFIYFLLQEDSRPISMGIGSVTLQDVTISEGRMN
ncbi:MAG: CvpA family protein [Phycisphaeraceae bacterium]|nr:CvpA family protein [Phycisphaeraceae bacterium]